MLLDMLIVVICITGVAFGWMAKADGVQKELDKAYHKGYADALRSMQDRTR